MNDSSTEVDPAAFAASLNPGTLRPRPMFEAPMFPALGPRKASEKRPVVKRDTNRRKKRAMSRASRKANRG